MKTNMIGDYRLRRLDEYNWTVEQRVRFRKKNSKSRPWKIIGYFPSLDQAAARLFDRILLGGKKEPLLEDLLRDIEAARDHIATLILRQPRAGTVDGKPSRVGEPGKESK